MQSIALNIDENINMMDFIATIQSIYGSKKVTPAVTKVDLSTTFGALPDIFAHPIQTTDFHLYSRGELNER